MGAEHPKYDPPENNSDNIINNVFGATGWKRDLLSGTPHKITDCIIKNVFGASGWILRDAD